MGSFLTLISFFFFLVVGNLSIASAQDFQVGQSVTLESKKPKGVPLHREPSPSYLKHVPNGTTASIQRIDQDEHRLSIQLTSGEVRWVHKKYVQANTAASTPILPGKSSSLKTPFASKTTMGGEHDVWTSKDQCQTAIQKGFRMVESSSAKLRVATWNLRWFPVGAAPDQPGGSAEPTDLDWLICALRWMQVDILAIQESLATPEATQAWKTITNQLSKQTGDTWRWHRQPCGRPDDHHVGLLWNDSRVTLSKFDSLWQFNSKASSARNACTSGLRPGQYAFVQSRQKDGADFHLIAVHLKSGPTVFAVEQRKKPSTALI